MVLLVFLLMWCTCNTCRVLCILWHGICLSVPDKRPLNRCVCVYLPVDHRVIRKFEYLQKWGYFPPAHWQHSKLSRLFCFFSWHTDGQLSCKLHNHVNETNTYSHPTRKISFAWQSPQEVSTTQQLVGISASLCFPDLDHQSTSLPSRSQLLHHCWRTHCYQQQQQLPQQSLPAACCK